MDKWENCIYWCVYFCTKERIIIATGPPAPLHFLCDVSPGGLLIMCGGIYGSKKANYIRSANC